MHIDEKKFELKLDYFESSCFFNCGEISFDYNWKELLQMIVDKVGLLEIVEELGEDDCLVEIGVDKCIEYLREEK